ncbi:MAG: hypothetical protein ACTTH0_03530 [Eubacteriales bacterium]
MKISLPPKPIELNNNGKFVDSPKKNKSFNKMLRGKLTEEEEVGILVEHIKKKLNALRTMCMQTKPNRQLSSEEKAYLKKKYNFSNQEMSTLKYEEFANELCEMGIISTPPVIDGYSLTNIHVNESLGCYEGEWTKVASSSTDFSSKSNDIDNLNPIQNYLYMLKNLEINYENFKRLGIYKGDFKSEVIRRQYEAHQTILKIMKELA